MSDQEDIVLPSMPTEAQSNEVSFLTIDEAMKLAWHRMKERFWTLILLNAIPYIFSFILSLAVVLSLAAVFSRGSNSALAVNDTPPLVLVTGIVCFIILLMVVWTWSILALIAAASNPVLLPIRDAYRQTKDKILPFWSIAILAFIIIGGSYVFFLIPGLIFSIFFCFWIFTFLLEGELGMNALLKSREYVRGEWWRVVGYIAILVVINIICSLIISLFSRVSQGLGGFIQLFEYLTLPVFSIVYFVVIFQRFQQVKGNMVFVPTTKQKAGYLVSGLLGFAIVLFFTVGTLSFFYNNPVYLQIMLQDIKNHQTQGLQR